MKLDAKHVMSVIVGEAFDYKIKLTTVNCVVRQTMPLCLELLSWIEVVNQIKINERMKIKILLQ